MQSKRTNLDRLTVAALDDAIHELRDRARHWSGCPHHRVNAAWELRMVVEHLLRPIRETVQQMEAAGLLKPLCRGQCGREATRGLLTEYPSCGKAACEKKVERAISMDEADEPQEAA